MKQLFDWEVQECCLSGNALRVQCVLFITIGIRDLYLKSWT